MPYRVGPVVMDFSMSRSTVSSSTKLLILAFGIGLSGIDVAQAGFLDTLFGRPVAAVRTIEPQRDPLHVTVSKKPRTKKAAVQVAPPIILQKSTLDSSKDPDWYLKDDTLRRGDFVVLPDRVLMVRDKASPRAATAFEDIRTSPRISKRERARILAMTRNQQGDRSGYRIVTQPTTITTTLNQLDRTTIPVIMP
jgi:hypothetical protein